MVESAAPTLFEAVIVPHRSLPPWGLKLLLGVLCLLCGGSAFMFVRLGAWPVGGFTGVELLLAAVLFRLNARGARASEMLLLSDSGMRVLRTDAKGRRSETTLPPGWLNVVLEERPGRVPGLLLVCPSQREEVARSLGEAEKRDLAAALTDALHTWRHPRFDNPQLRGA